MIASAAAAPVPSRGGSDKWLNIRRVRDLEQTARPVLQAAQPVADGVNAGATGLGDHAANSADAAGAYPF